MLRLEDSQIRLPESTQHAPLAFLVATTAPRTGRFCFVAWDPLAMRACVYSTGVGAIETFPPTPTTVKTTGAGAFSGLGGHYSADGNASGWQEDRIEISGKTKQTRPWLSPVSTALPRRAILGAVGKSGDDPIFNAALLFCGFRLLLLEITPPHADTPDPPSPSSCPHHRPVPWTHPSATAPSAP